MNKDLIVKAILKAGEQAAGLLEERAEEIAGDIRAQYLAADADKKFSVSLSMPSKITEAGTNLDVKTDLTWAVKKKATAECEVSLQPNLTGPDGSDPFAESAVDDDAEIETGSDADDAEIED